MPDLARLYDLHADDCVRTAEKIDNPGHRAMLLKAAEEWRQAAQAHRQSMRPHKSSPLARNCTLNTRLHTARGQEGVVVNRGLRGCEARAKARQSLRGRADLPSSLC